jgi:hypothetical protein
MIGLLNRVRRGRADAAEAVAVQDFYRRGIPPDSRRPTAARSAAYAAQAAMTDRLTAYRAVSMTQLARELDMRGDTPERAYAAHLANRAADERYAMRCRAEARAEIEAAHAARARPLVVSPDPLIIEAAGS